MTFVRTGRRDGFFQPSSEEGSEGNAEGNISGIGTGLATSPADDEMITGIVPYIRDRDGDIHFSSPPMLPDKNEPTATEHAERLFSYPGQEPW